MSVVFLIPSSVLYKKIGFFSYCKNINYSTLHSSFTSDFYKSYFCFYSNFRTVRLEIKCSLHSCFNLQNLYWSHSTSYFNNLIAKAIQTLYSILVLWRKVRYGGREHWTRSGNTAQWPKENLCHHGTYSLVRGFGIMENGLNHIGRSGKALLIGLHLNKTQAKG